MKVPELSGTSAIATVRLQDGQGRPFRSLSWLGSPRSEWRMTQGELRLRSLPPGTWNVTVTTADGRSWQGTQSTAPNAPAELKLN